MPPVSADEVVLELQARTAAHDAALVKSAEVYEQSMARIKRAAVGAEAGDEARTRANIGRRLRLASAVRGEADVIVQQSARSANATRNLGRQISDIGVGLAGGQSPFLILAQQAPQVADALADTQGKAARLAGFFAGPWGAALLAAGSIVAILGSELLSAGDDAVSANVKFEKTNQTLAAMKQRAKEAADEIQRLISTPGTERMDQVSATIRDAAVADAAARRLAKQAADLDRQGPSIVGDAAATAAAEAGRLRRIAQLNAQAKAFRESAAASRQAAAGLQLVDKNIRKNEQDRFNEQDAKKQETADNKAERAALKAAKAEDSRAAALEDQYAQVSAAAREYADVVKDINAFEASGRFTPQVAETMRRAAEVARVAAAGKGEDRESINDILKRPGGITDMNETLGRRIEENQEAAQDRWEQEAETERRLYQERQKNIQTLAGIYRSAFEGGAKGIGEALKNALINAISIALAKQTIGSFAGLFGASAKSGFVGDVLSSLTGRAGGGPVAAGQMYRVNERPGGVEGFVPAQSGKIIPLGRMRGVAGGGGDKTFNINVDARNSVTPAGFAQDLSQRILSQAAQMDAQTAKGVYKAIPQRVQESQQNGI